MDYRQAWNGFREYVRMANVNYGADTLIREMATQEAEGTLHDLEYKKAWCSLKELILKDYSKKPIGRNVLLCWMERLEKENGIGDNGV